MQRKTEWQDDYANTEADYKLLRQLFLARAVETKARTLNAPAKKIFRRAGALSCLKFSARDFCFPIPRRMLHHRGPQSFVRGMGRKL